MQTKSDYDFTRKIMPFGVIPELAFVLLRDLNLPLANSNCWLLNISYMHEALSKSYFFNKIIRLSANGSSRDSKSSRNGRVPSRASSH